MLPYHGGLLSLFKPPSSPFILILILIQLGKSDLFPVSWDMATYVYETIPSKPGEKPEQFEVRQSMNDQPLTKHPKNGRPVRRLISGGLGILGGKGASAPASHGCGPGSCGCGKF